MMLPAVYLTTNPGESSMANGQQHVEGSAFPKNQVFMAISAVFVGYFINSYFQQSLGNAAPKIAAAFPNGIELISWSISIPSLGLAIATLLGGKLSDIYGRRALLLSALFLILVGTGLICFSASFPFWFFIVARIIQSLGVGIIAPLCYTVIGDIFSAATQRGKWIGLLSLPMGIALIGTITSPFFIDTIKIWQLIFWCILPLIVLGIVFAFRMPALVQGADAKIDVLGAILIASASSAIIFGFSFAGTTYPWSSWQVISLLGAAVIFGALFLLAESKAKEPFLYIELLKNRTFMTISIAGFLSFFGMMSITLYFQVFMQAIQSRSTMASSLIGQLPVSILMSFIGVPTGFLLAKTKRYKPLLVTGYALAAAAMIAMIFFDNGTPWLLEALVATLTGLGLGVIPTINTMLIPAAVPRRLIGSAMAVLFFSISIGMSIAVAIQGSAINVRYSSMLNASLPEALTNPEALKNAANKDTVALIGDYRVLLSNDALNNLEKTINKIEGATPELFNKTVSAIRSSAESGLKIVFLLGAVTMALAFLLIVTVPIIPMDRAAEKTIAPETEAVRS
jgi:MFS family permease